MLEKDKEPMSTDETAQAGQAGDRGSGGRGVRIIKPHQFDSNTAQTPGMQRMAAISHELAGSQGIWGGITVVAPNTASGIHHHGEGRK
jgi:uncharacterized RmlC-like cupin family protein